MYQYSHPYLQLTSILIGQSLCQAGGYILYVNLYQPFGKIECGRNMQMVPLAMFNLYDTTTTEHLAIPFGLPSAWATEKLDQMYWSTITIL